MQFSAILLLGTPSSATFSQVEAELKRLAPEATLGDLGGLPDRATNPGAAMISVNGESMSVKNIPIPAETKVIEREHFANHIWPTVEADVARHHAHILVAATRNAIGRESALAQARAVTLLAAAFARLVPLIGVRWVEGSNSMDANTFIKLTENIGRPDANAVPLWVRVMAYQEPSKGSQVRTIGGTLGLHFLGLTDLEYAAAPFLNPGFILMHAWSTPEYLLRSGKTFQDGETIGIEGAPRSFKVSHAKDGVFVPFPVARLSEVKERSKWWRWLKHFD